MSEAAREQEPDGDDEQQPLEWPDSLPKETYRDLLIARANGFETDPLELEVWRREEELIRAALAHGSKFMGCGVLPPHFMAPGHRLAWEAVMCLFEQCPQQDYFDSSALLSTMRSLDDAFMAGRRGTHWMHAVLGDDAVSAEHGLEITVPNLLRNWRNRIWHDRMQEIGERLDIDSDFSRIEQEFVHAAANMVLEVAQDGEPIQPSSRYHWDPTSSAQLATVPLHIPPIDEASGGGIGPGEMMSIGGGTSHGKSYSAQHIMKLQAQHEQTAGYISCEDPRELWFCRNVASYSEPPLSPKSIRMRTADPQVVYEAMAHWRAEYAEHLYDMWLLKPTVEQVCRAIRHLRYGRGVRLIVVDYIQAIRAIEEPTTNKVHEMSLVTSELKKCAKQCKIGLIVYSQYARDAYKDGREPEINAFKYCGDIENESELVAMLWRDREGQLRVKIPKSKWSMLEDKQYLIDVHEVTGCHLGWKEDLGPRPEPEDEPRRERKHGAR